jgi:hypothetical protein
VGLAFRAIIQDTQIAEIWLEASGGCACACVDATVALPSAPVLCTDDPGLSTASPYQEPFLCSDSAWLLHVISLSSLTAVCTDDTAVLTGSGLAGVWGCEPPTLAVTDCRSRRHVVAASLSSAHCCLAAAIFRFCSHQSTAFVLTVTHCASLRSLSGHACATCMS